MTAAARKLVMAILVAVGLVAPCAAHGAQYTVHACGDAAHNENHLFVGSVSDARMAARTLCAADAAGHTFGVGVLAGVGQGVVPVFANATQSFLAPPGTTISRVHVKADAHTSNGDWAALLQASTNGFSTSFWNVGGCNTRPGETSGCTAASPAVDQNHDTPGATGVRAVVACGNFTGCGTFTTSSWPFSRAYYLMHQVDLTLEDSSVPAVTVIGGGLADSGWVRGSQRVVYEASDNSGVVRSNLVVDDTVFDHFERPCDYTFAVPCGNLNDATFSLDTARIGDGPHRITVAAFDATDANRGVASRTVLIDNHAPAEPSGASVAGGEGWHTTDDFTIQWTNPSSAAPITRALYEVCRPGGSSCVSGEQTGSGISQLTGVHVGQPGDYTIRVWLADAAGNLSDAKSAPLHLKFDNVPPAQAQPQHRNGWVNQNDAKRLDQQIDPNGNPPVSGISGYAVTSDGTEPGANVNVPAAGTGGYVAHQVLTDLPEGTTTFKARAISGAGIASREVGSTDIHVDLTAPDVSVDGVPSEHQWSRVPVVAHIHGTDPGGLSGMASGPDDRGIEAGGYVDYTVDQGVHTLLKGPQREQRPD
ncbi:MAG: large repetitive protein, partial [Thermoleophilaceae bacterium]|nr:large repetitive protein [Thermoleophilaceae bacterium]